MIAAILSRTVGEGECLIWLGAKSDNGYGVMRSAGRMEYIHRLAYESAVGPIPPGFWIDHLCRRRDCVEPSHLEAVQPGVNTLRGTSPVAQFNRGACHKGHDLSLPDAIYVSPKGSRACRRCQSDRQRARRSGQISAEQFQLLNGGKQ